MRLPVIQLQPSAPTGRFKLGKSRRAVIVHMLRMLVIVGFLAGLHALAARQLRNTHFRLPELALIRLHLPETSRLVEAQADRSLMLALDEKGAALGIIAQTSPQADNIVGYAGPCNVMLILREDQSVRKVVLLSSRDTTEHVRRVENADDFWKQFVEWRWGEQATHQIDGVGGATLTSLAIAESIVLRMSGVRQSLRFPEPISLKEVQQLVPGTVELVFSDRQTSWVRMLDANGKTIGSIIRTGPLVDSIEGYQGPSELIVYIDEDEIVQKIGLRQTFDNEPYVRYVKQEASFWAAFRGMSLVELAAIDLQTHGIEGVSGATMTSMAAARTLQEACRISTLAKKSNEDVRNAWHSGWNWSWTEIATATFALVAIPWSCSRQRGQRRTRLVWQLTSMIVIGVVCGSLLSLSLIAGWTRGGVPYRLAPGLFVLLVVAYVWPAISKRNVYCDHICPHGIVQQWLARNQQFRRSIFSMNWLWIDPRRRVNTSHMLYGMFDPRTSWQWMARVLNGSAYGCILLALGWVVFDWPVNLAWLEPFDTYAWRIGVSVSLAVWIGSLLVAWHKPMAYCRFACPTGKTLAYVRFGAGRRKIGPIDAILAPLTALLWLVISVT